jgi:hypothetical protein
MDVQIDHQGHQSLVGQFSADISGDISRDSIPAPKMANQENRQN